METVRSRPSTPKSMMILLDPEDPAACPRCGGKVFEAEKISSRSFLFHKNCFSCKACGHRLDATTSMEGPNGEVYCKTCYVKEYFTGEPTIASRIWESNSNLFYSQVAGTNLAMSVLDRKDQPKIRTFAPDA